MKNTDTHLHGDEIEYNETVIEYLPDQPDAFRIAALFHQKAFDGDSLLRKPNILVSVILPDDAEAFDFIRDGDLDGLIESLNSKRTRLSDRDRKGRCLLNVSIIETGMLQREDPELTSTAYNTF